MSMKSIVCAQKPCLKSLPKKQNNLLNSESKQRQEILFKDFVNFVQTLCEFSFEDKK